MALGAGLTMVCIVNRTKYNYNKISGVECKNSQTLHKYLASDKNSNLDEVNLKKITTLTKNEKDIHMDNSDNQDKIINAESADFASEVLGGTILDTPDTHSFYNPTQNQITILGIPLWKPLQHTPRKVIQRWNEAGECWAFRGTRGKIEIKLAYSVIIDKVTLEHIPKSLSPTGNINSAPKSFNVLGKVENQYVLIDSFMYKEDGLPSQVFQIRNPELKSTPLQFVILEILTNYGNLDYTCVYRFKVHGKIHKLPDHKNNNYVH